MTFSDEELKRFAELGGIQSECAHEIGICNDLPHFPSSFPACFDVLEKFCEKRALIWEVGSRVGETRIFCLLEREKLDADDADEGLVRIGDTKQDAIIQAVLAADKLTEGK